MATQIYTCSVYKNNPAKVIHNGDISVGGFLMWSGGTNAGVSTVGDTAYLCKIPHGAQIVDFWEYHSTGASSQGMQFGLDAGVVAAGAGASSCLIAGGAAQATMNRFNITNWKAVAGTVGPPLVSISDGTSGPKYAKLTGNITAGTTTTSLKVWFNIIYRMDGPQLTPAGAEGEVP